MPDIIPEGRRVAVDKAHVDFVKAMHRSDGESHAPFDTIADLLAFSAAYAVRKNKFTPVETKSSKPGPIRLGIFSGRGYEYLIDLLAVYRDKDVTVLQADQKAIDQRVMIFEGYANAGLFLLCDRLKGHADKLDGLELLLGEVRAEEGGSEDVDLTGV